MSPLQFGHEKPTRDTKPQVRDLPPPPTTANPPNSGQSFAYVSYAQSERLLAA